MKNLEEYTMPLPAYTIGEKAYEKVDDIVAPSGHKAVAVGGVRALAAWSKEWEKAQQKTTITGVIPFGGEANTEVADALAHDERVMAAEMIFAIGGGRAMDFGKYLSSITHKPLYTFPTIAATCAPITRLGVFYDAHHAFVRHAFFGIPPLHCFINTRVIAEAPAVYLWAGIGDTLAKNYESHFASRGDSLDHSNWLGLTIAPISSEGLVQHATQGMKDCQDHRDSYELEQTILAIIVSTGLVSITVLDEYNSSLAHALYYALTNLPQIDARHLHGEVVSYGVLVLLTLDHEFAERDKLYAFMKSVSLPTCLGDLEVRLDEADGILDQAVNGGDLGKHPYPITVEMVHEAIVALEAYHQSQS